MANPQGDGHMQLPYFEDIVVIRRRTRLDTEGTNERYWQVCSTLTDADAVLGMIHRGIEISTKSAHYSDLDMKVVGLPPLLFSDEDDEDEDEQEADDGDGTEATSK